MASPHDTFSEPSWVSQLQAKLTLGYRVSDKTWYFCTITLWLGKTIKPFLLFLVMKGEGWFLMMTSPFFLINLFFYDSPSIASISSIRSLFILYKISLYPLLFLPYSWNLQPPPLSHQMLGGLWNKYLSTWLGMLNDEAPSILHNTYRSLFCSTYSTSFHYFSRY
jgi:hypothetical protein